MKRQVLVIVGAIAVVAGLVAMSVNPAFATKFKLFASLDGPQSIKECPQGSAGTGIATVSYQDDTNVVSWNIPYQGLSGPATAAHFHGPASPGIQAPIQVDFGVSLDSPIAGSAVISEAQEAELLGGDWYVNIHTAKCPSGEIRGHVLAAPVGGVPLDSQLEGVAPLTGPNAPDGGANRTPWVVAASVAGALALVGAGWAFARRRA